MKITCQNLESLVCEEFERLPGEINELSKVAFENVYGSELASKTKNIIYFFLSSKPVPRLNGESKILYIGQTKRTFKERNNPYANKDATSKANRLKYGLVIEKYGPIKVAFCDYKKFGDSRLSADGSRRHAEGQFLWWYFQNHGEYPPINYTKTKVRNDTIYY